MHVTPAADSGRSAFAQAGLTPADIDVVELYDAFTINPILFLEDLGFCPKGEGGAFVEGGRIAPGGRFPMNTNGGGLSCTHPGMYSIFLVIEAVAQLRRRSRCAPGYRCRGGAGAWQRRRAVEPGHRDSGHFTLTALRCANLS